MTVLHKSNLCMEAVLAHLESHSEKYRDEYGDGAVLGAYVEDGTPKIVVLPFTTEKEAIDYRDYKLPDSLRGAAVVVPISAHVALML